MNAAPTVNGLRAVSIRIVHPWRGAWVIDAELDPDLVALAPASGPAVVQMGGATLTGTVDPRGSSTFASMASVRVVAGRGGWEKTIPALHYHLDNGVTSTAVYSAAAAIVGEVVVEQIPTVFGVDYMRSAGPASRVFGDVDWWVDLTGITNVGTRLPAVPDLSLTVIAWDAVQQRAEITCDALVLPGTILLDPRFNGQTYTVRDVEQTYDANGSHVVAWCSSNPVSRLAVAMANAVREMARTATLKVYLYRIVLEGPDGRLQLQAVNPSAGMPAVTLPLSVWPGMQGDTATYTLSSLVLVHFVEQAAGLPPQPVVLGFAPGTLPEKRGVDALIELDLGPSATLVALAGGSTPLVLAPWASGLASALLTFANALNAAASGPLAPIGAPATALATALGALPAPATLKTVAA